MCTFQKGITWHLIAYELCTDAGESGPKIDTQVHQCIIDDDSPQSNVTVIAMILDSLKVYAKAYPQVKEVYLSFDNAG